MAHIVILGGSFAGFEAAVSMRKLLGDRVRVTVVDQSGTFQFRPSLPWVVFEGRDPESVCVPLAPLLASYGIEYVRDRVEAVEPGRDVVHGRRGRYPYDFLIVALGAASPPERPPGWGAIGYSPLWLDEAVRLRHALERFSGGDLVVALHPRSPLSCAAYEMVFQAAAFLRRRGLRNRSRLAFVTYEDSPFTAGGPRASRIVRRWMRQEGIRFLPGTFVEQARDGALVLGDGYVLPADLAILIPPYRGSPFLRDIPDLTDAEGFVVTDQAMRTRAHANIFAAGDCVAFPGPKTGFMAEQQGRVAAVNIAADFGLAEPTQYNSALPCLIDLGPGRGLLTVRQPVPQHGWVQTRLVAAGSVPLALKRAFERYFLSHRLRIRKTPSRPGYR
ncbi:MAG: FAD-dependent oxidoreductase [Firmicutes bacterium]|nr:FAD-dependent oxidoreductase [Bacillota bacterium]